MCVDYIGLNKACPKDSYRVASIYMDAYTRYNKIPMYDLDRGNTAFITKQAKY